MDRPIFLSAALALTAFAAPLHAQDTTKPDSAAKPPASPPAAVAPDTKPEPRTPPAPALRRTTLDNGMTLLMQPIPGADRVAVIALYNVGFIDEPKGLPQSSHLLEHLRIFAATASYAAGESWPIVQSKGLAGAETMADFSHFDFVLPTADLDIALKIEAERLSSLHILPEVIREQAPTMLEELRQVEAHPQAPFFKYAAVAVNQVWRGDAHEILLHASPDTTPVPDLQKLLDQHYTTDNMTLVLAGGFDPTEALEAVKRFLGVIAPGPAVPSAPIDFAKLQKEQTVRWDLPGLGLFVTCPPPADPIDRAIMNFWGDFLYPRLYQDDAINVPTRCIFSSNLQWPVGRMPFLIYATAMEGFSLDDAQKMVLERLDAMAAEVTPTELTNLRALAHRTAAPAPTTWDEIKAAAEHSGADPAQARNAVLGNLALKLGMNDRATGGQAARIAARLDSMSTQDVRDLIKRTIDPATRSVIRLEPVKAKQ
jgi:predicted Zn-dependent peptidase